MMVKFDGLTIYFKQGDVYYPFQVPSSPSSTTAFGGLYQPASIITIRGTPHNLTGPAVIYSTAIGRDSEYYVNGKNLSYEEWKKHTTKLHLIFYEN